MISLCTARASGRPSGCKTLMVRRLAQCKLELHPEKTKIVYCKDEDRTRRLSKRESLIFWGLTFRPRGAKSRWGRYFVSFSPAVSKKAAKSMRSVIRGWRLHRRQRQGSPGSVPHVQSQSSVVGLTIMAATTSLHFIPLFDQLNRSLKRWAMRKYKRLRGRQRRAAHWLRRIRRQQPGLFRSLATGLATCGWSIGAG